ncbi:MAG: DUF3048 domain-containing protein [Ruminococcaceae bacterium]|nr:DUF3048 domain-containing protein [Oscillospiraceae bacterium]
MKKATKKLVAAALAALVATSALTGCNRDKNDNTTADPFATLPEQTTQSSDTSSSESTSSSETSDSSSDSSSSTEKPDTPINPEMKGFNVLTGAPTLNDVSYTRPVAIVVDNVNAAYSTQTGLDQADILYEALVAPGITRFLMVTADYKLLDKVSNIRSGRDYHMDFASYHNAVLVCHGGSNTVNYDFFTLAAERYGNRFGFVDTSVERYFSWADDGNKYGTIESANRKDLAHNTVFKPSAMTDLLESSSSKFIADGKGTLSGQAKETLKFVEYGTKKDLSGASSATEVTLKFKCKGSSNVKNVSYTYDAETGKYLRSQDGSAHLDSQTGKQLSFTNVVTLFTDVEAKDTGLTNDPTMTVLNTKPTGEKGFGYCFTDGKVINIFWKVVDGALKLEEENGSELTLNTGNTYIGYLDHSYIASGQFWQ